MRASRAERGSGLEIWHCFKLLRWKSPKRIGLLAEPCYLLGSCSTGLISGELLWSLINVCVYTGTHRALRLLFPISNGSPSCVIRRAAVSRPSTCLWLPHTVGELYRKPSTAPEKPLQQVRSWKANFCVCVCFFFNNKNFSFPFKLFFFMPSKNLLLSRV